MSNIQLSILLREPPPEKSRSKYSSELSSLIEEKNLKEFSEKECCFKLVHQAHKEVYKIILIELDKEKWNQAAMYLCEKGSLFKISQWNKLFAEDVDAKHAQTSPKVSCA